MIDALLRERALQGLLSGKLPKRIPDRTWGGPGAGEKCPVCERAVGAQEIEMEIQIAREGRAHLDVYHLHMYCFAAWELERTRIGDSDARKA